MEMKRLFLLALSLLLLACVNVTSATAASSLNVRSVTVLQATTEPGYEDLGEYVRHRVVAPFKYPYYELNQEILPPVPLTRLDLERVSEETDADIVVAPVLAHWNQYTYPPVGYIWRDGDPMVRTSCIVRIYLYERGDNSLRDVEVRYFNTEEESSQTSPFSILRGVMNEVMKKYPYQRIPVDVPTMKPDVQPARI